MESQIALLHHLRKLTATDEERIPINVSSHPDRSDHGAIGRAVELRDELTRSLLADETINSAAVEAAFRAVPRHVFAPESSWTRHMLARR